MPPTTARGTATLGGQLGAIQRGLIGIEEQGGDRFFGEPMLNIDDLMQTDARGQGVVNILAADKLMNSPRLYSAFLLWMLSELFEQLPEVGDLDKPKLVFFFDEAHLLFDEAPKPLMEKIEQVVRLIRSKGVGVFFVTQNPLDIPDTVLGQLGNRVQHALRAYTPRDQKAVKAAAETFRPNPALDTAQAITELGVGEALVSFLDEKGRPTWSNAPSSCRRHRRSARSTGAERRRRWPVAGRWRLRKDGRPRVRARNDHARAWQRRPRRHAAEEAGAEGQAGEPAKADRRGRDARRPVWRRRANGNRRRSRW